MIKIFVNDKLVEEARVCYIRAGRKFISLVNISVDLGDLSGQKSFYFVTNSSIYDNIKGFKFCAHESSKIDEIHLTKFSNSYGVLVQKLQKCIPSLATIVNCPDETCEQFNSSRDLWTMIQHLNDAHRWQRERIADWLETLDINLEFRLEK